jgi:hypothetical protein
MLNTLAMILGWVVCSTLIGAIIGFVCKGRTAVELVLTFAVTSGLYIFLAWSDGLNRVQWSSFEDAYSALLTFAGPFIYFIVVPGASAAFLIGRWRRGQSATR